MSLLRRLRQARRPPDAVSPGARRATALEQSALTELSPETIAAMARVVEREFPTFPARLAAARAAREVERLLAEDADLLPAAPPAPARHLPSRATGRRAVERCPQCGGTSTTVTRIDLTVGASWFECRDCGLRFGGSLVDESGNAPHRF